MTFEALSEMLILRPKPDSDLVDLTRAVIARWPDYPYYGGVYDSIEPHLSLGFGAAEELQPIATVVTARRPLYVEAATVTLLVGPHQRMRPGPSFPLGAVGD